MIVGNCKIGAQGLSYTIGHKLIRRRKKITMSKILKPHQYSEGNIPLRYCVPTFAVNRVPYRLCHAVSKTPKHNEDCFICMNRINFREKI